MFSTHVHFCPLRGSSLIREEEDSQQFLRAFLFLEQVGAEDSDSGVGVVVGAEVCEGAGVEVCEGASAEAGLGVIN